MLAISATLHGVLFALLLAWAALAPAPPPPPEQAAQVELVIGENAAHEGPSGGPPADPAPPEPSKAPAGVADADKGKLAQAPEQKTPEQQQPQAATPPPPAPPDETAPSVPPPQAAEAPAPPAPPPPQPKPLKPSPPVPRTTAPTPVDNPGRPPTEAVPLPEVRLADGSTAPPAEILDPNPNLTVAEADAGNVAPIYPQEAARRGESGVVVLRLHVDATGRVESVEIVRSSGSRSIDRVSRERLATWHYRPAMLNGVAVPDVVEQSLRFIGRNDPGG